MSNQIKDPFFQLSKYEGTSAKYKFVDTYKLAARLQSMGYEITRKVVGGSRKYQGYQKHLVFFSRPEWCRGDYKVELCLCNAHCGTHSLRFDLGIWRYICSNGLVVGDTFWAAPRIRHVGFTYDKLEQTLETIKCEVPRLVALIKRMRETRATLDMTRVLVEAAAAARFPGTQKHDVDLWSFDASRRNEDLGEDLFTTFNRVQENVMRGGVKYWTTRRDKNGVARPVRRVARAVKAVDSTLKLNKALWDAAAKLVA